MEWMDGWLDEVIAEVENEQKRMKITFESSDNDVRQMFCMNGYCCCCCCFFLFFPFFFGAFKLLTKSRGQTKFRTVALEHQKKFCNVQQPRQEQGIVGLLSQAA